MSMRRMVREDMRRLDCPSMLKWCGSLANYITHRQKRHLRRQDVREVNLPGASDVSSFFGLQNRYQNQKVYQPKAELH